MQLVKLVVDAALRQQLLVRAHLADLAFVHDDDLVGALNRGEAVRDDERGAAFDQLVSASRTRISVSVSTLEVASSRIRILGLCASARAKEMSCFWPVESVLPRSCTGSLNPLGSVRMKSARFTSSAACSTCFVGDPVGAEADVLLDRAGEQERILQHDAEAAAQIVEIHVADVDAVDADRALLHVVEAQQQRDDRGLAGAGVADDGDGLAGFDGEGDVAENPVGFVGACSDGPFEPARGRAGFMFRGASSFDPAEHFDMRTRRDRTRCGRGLRLFSVRRRDDFDLAYRAV